MIYRCHSGNVKGVMDAKTFLEAKGLSIRKAAEQIGVATTSLSRPIKGERWPSETVLVKMHELSAGQVALADWIETCRPLLESQGIIQPQGNQ